MDRCPPPPPSSHLLPRPSPAAAAGARAAVAAAYDVREFEKPLACVERESGRLREGGEGVRTQVGVKACLTVLGRDRLCNAAAAAAVAAAAAAAAADVDANASLWVSIAVPALPAEKMLSKGRKKNKQIRQGGGKGSGERGSRGGGLAMPAVRSRSGDRYLRPS